MNKWFMKHRGSVVDIYNNHIDAVNKEWDLTGKPAAFGDYLEDINPEYITLIKDKIQPYIDAYNKRFRLFKYEIDEIGDIVAKISFIKNSRLWITLKEIES